MAVQDPSIDSVNARNNTKVYLSINHQRVGRVQSFRQDVSNNVQVLTELGRDVAVELKKGITIFTFSIARFYCRSDAMDAIKGGQVFSLGIRDTAGSDGSGAA